MKNRPPEKTPEAQNCRSDGFLTSTLRMFRTEMSVQWHEAQPRREAGRLSCRGERSPTCGDRGFESPFLHQRVIYRRSAQGDRIGGASMQGFGPAIARRLR